MDIEFDSIDGFSALNARQQQFCIAYVQSGNAASAAKAAGYSPKSAEVIGSKLRKNLKIRTVIDGIRREIFSQEALTLEESKAICARIARASMGDFMINGSVVPSLVADGHQAVETFEDGEDGVKIKLRDPVRAIKLAAELSGWTSRQESSAGSVGSVNYFFGFKRDK